MGMRVLTTVAPRLSATAAAALRFGSITATTVPSPSGGSSSILDSGTAPATSTPALRSSAASPCAAPGERAPPSSTTGRPSPELLRFAASSQKAAEEAAALGRRGGLHEVRGPPLGAEVHQGGYDAVLEVGGEGARDFVGGVGVHHLGGQVQLAGHEPGLERGVDPERLRRASRHEQHELRAPHPCGALHDAGGQKALLRGVVGVEDREDHTRVVPEGGEVLGARRRQALDKVRFGLRAGDDHEGVLEASRPGYLRRAEGGERPVSPTR